MATARIEPVPETRGWAAVRLLITTLVRLGYIVEEHRVLGASVLHIA